MRGRDRLRHRVGSRRARRLRRRSRARGNRRAIRARRHRRAPTEPGQRRGARARLGAPGSCGLHRERAGSGAAAARGDRCLAGRGRRCRHRLHVVHDAAHARRRDAAQHAGCPEARAARLGEAVEASRRAAGGGSDQRGGRGARRGVAPALRREDLVGVVLREGAADPRRGAGGLRSRRPADRGLRLDRLAADRGREQERVRRGLQGDVVEGRRVPDAGVLRRARSSLRARRRREAVADAPPARRPSRAC